MSAIRLVQDNTQPGMLDGKPPPMDLDAEAAVLSAVMIESSSMDLIVDTVSVADFYSEAHRRIFEACSQLHASGTPTDIATVASRLKEAGRLEQVGGIAYLTEILDAAPNLANLAAYARTVTLKATQRRLISCCDQVRAELYLGKYENAEGHFDEVEQRVYEICKPISGGNMPERISKTSRRLVQNVIEGKKETTLATHFHDYDRLTGGLRKKHLTIVGGLTSMGKTVWGNNIALNVAAQNIGVLYTSLEMSADELVQRMACSRSGVDQAAVRDADLTEKQYNAYLRAHGEIGMVPMYIADEPAQTVATVRGKARRVRSQLEKVGGSLGLVIVDYLQLMKAMPIGKNGTREQEISELALQLKNLAKDLDCHVMALVQLNDDGSKRKGDAKRPKLGDIRDSKAVAFHADVVSFVWREAYERERDDRGGGLPDRHAAELIVAKARGGRTGVVELVFDRSLGRFENAPIGGFRHEGDC